VVSIIALLTIGAVPCTISKNLSVLSAISYGRTLSFGNTFRNTYAIKTGADGAQASKYRSAFQRSPIHATTGARREHWADTRNGKEGGPKQQSPEASQKAPVLPQYFIRSPLL
jgi:hypothetical protein